MKTSQKILLSYIIFLMLGFLGFIIYAITGPNNNFESFTKELDFPSQQFSTLIVENTQNGHLTFIDSNKERKIEFVNVWDSTFTAFNWKLRNDTLYISKDTSQPYLQMKIIVDLNSLNKVICKNARLNISHFRSGNLEAKILKSRFQLDSCHVDTMLINATSGSEIRPDNTDFEYVELSLDSSRFYYQRELKHINSTIKNNSIMQIKQFQSLELERDSTSRIYFFYR